MPFGRKGPAGLTARLDVRVAPAEKARLRDMAAAVGMPVSELVRSRALGRPVVSRTDATTIRELRRLGGLLKHVDVESHGAYSPQTVVLPLMGPVDYPNGSFPSERQRCHTATERYGRHPSERRLSDARDP